MLQELRIRNFAIIDELDINFSKGLNILTGETGTGKSIILNAVRLLLGDKVTDEVIRSSEEEATIEALFDISQNWKVKERMKEKIPRLSGEGEEDSLLIRRIISRSGRGKAFLNEHLVTLGLLTWIGEDLLSIYGQHEHQSLLRVETHIDILDEFGGLFGLRKEFGEKYQRFMSLSEEVQRIREEKERRAKERDLMAFQSKEIEASGIQPGEEEALKEERAILTHAQKLMVFANTSEEMLYGGEGSATERIQTVIHQGSEMATIDSSLSQILNNLKITLVQLEEVAFALRGYSKKIEINPARLQEIEDRLDEIDRLKRKYGSTIEEILSFKKKVDDALRSFTSYEEKLQQMEELLTPLKKEIDILAENLSSERSRVALELEKAIENELGSLGMRKTTFEIHRENTPISHKGIDRVEFLISTNVGEELKPLAKIASGGELSRMMLAIKRILAKVGGSQVLIFDEVDSGIGGAIAEVVGRKLKELSRHHQVICVTHLPQIACFADNHFSVKKEVRTGRTTTLVKQLGKDAIVDEIARMLGGVKVTEKTRVHAKEMIENAKKGVR